MKKISFIIAFLISVVSLTAQVKNDTVDYKYRDDQLYISFSTNLLVNKPESDSSSLFSGGFSLGYIFDIPINERRNAGIGVGLGYAYNSYGSNFLMNVEERNNIYESSRFKTQLIEIPIELRWRTSTPLKYNFWRIYGGVKVSYLFHSNSKFELDGKTIKINNIEAFNKFQYGLILSAGYGSWNLSAYYGLSPIFNDVIVNEKSLNLKDFNLGLKFYIL